MFDIFTYTHESGLVLLVTVDYNAESVMVTPHDNEYFSGTTSEETIAYMYARELGTELDYSYGTTTSTMVMKPSELPF